MSATNTVLSRRASGGFVDRADLAEGDSLVLLAVEREGSAGLLPTHGVYDELVRSLPAVGFTGKPGSSARVPHGPASVTVVGVREGASALELAAAAATGVRASAGARRILVDVDVEPAVLYPAALLATYRFDAYKAATVVEAEEVLVVGDAPDDVDRLDDLVAATCFARDVTTLPPADKTPPKLAERITEAAAAAGVDCRRYDEDAIRELGMHGLLAVARASDHRPVLLRLSAPGTGDGTVAVVGKGLTYDAGGLNIKLQMLEMMKLDVGGAAAAVGAVLHAGRFPRRRGLTVWVGLCENVISGDAYRGGDVLRMRNGTTVEIANTDAEGRLTLADGMSVAADESPDLLVTIATLTGSAMAALGMRTGALMTSDDDLAEALLGAAASAGEDLWRMPLRPHFAEPLESQVADLNNLGEQHRAQTMIAATFLQRFVPDALPYAHLDIAGPAYNPGKPYAFVPHGGTGYGVATLVELLDR